MFNFTDDRYYIGEWKNNLMNGYGEFLWNDGKKYIGIYKNDKKEGFGTFYWPDVKKFYVGFWKNGKQDGVGLIINKTNIRKIGIWKEGIEKKTIKKLWEIENSIIISELHLKFFKMDHKCLCNFMNV